jgi:hypothetical protein
VEREEGSQQHSGEVEMEDGGWPAAVESATGARSRWCTELEIGGEWNLENDVSRDP